MLVLWLKTMLLPSFDVVILDVLTDKTAHIYQQQLQTENSHITLLLPTLAESLKRNQARGQYLTDEEVTLLYDWQIKLSIVDQTIDNSDIPAETISQRLAQLRGQTD